MTSEVTHVYQKKHSLIKTKTFYHENQHFFVILALPKFVLFTGKAICIHQWCYKHKSFVLISVEKLFLEYKIGTRQSSGKTRQRYHFSHMEFGRRIKLDYVNVGFWANQSWKEKNNNSVRHSLTFTHALYEVKLSIIEKYQISGSRISR